MSQLSDLFDDRRQQFAAGRSKLSALQAVMDSYFPGDSCTVALKTAAVLIYVGSAGLAHQVQLQKHTLVHELQAIEPTIKSVRIIIGKPPAD